MVSFCISGAELWSYATSVSLSLMADSHLKTGAQKITVMSHNLFKIYLLENYDILTTVKMWIVVIWVVTPSYSR